MQLVDTMLITNNHTSFHLWWKEKLAKYQKFSKYYVHRCSINIWLHSVNKVILHIESLMLKFIPFDNCLFLPVFWYNKY